MAPVSTSTTGKTTRPPSNRSSSDCGGVGRAEPWPCRVVAPSSSASGDRQLGNEPGAIVRAGRAARYSVSAKFGKSWLRAPLYARAAERGGGQFPEDRAVFAGKPAELPEAVSRGDLGHGRRGWGAVA
jgi:hypothetical protein